MLKNILWVFLVSMLPVVELRGSILVGCSLDLPWWVNYLTSVIGNFLPVPFLLLFIRELLHWMKKVRYLDRFALFVENRVAKHSVKVLKYASLGLFLFVAIPIPGTGAWMGATIAAFLDMRMKYALPSILCGILVAGCLVVCAAYGFLSFLSFLV